MTTVRFAATDGVRLVGDVAEAPDAVGLAIVCHPLALNGGSMTAGLVPLMQRALVRHGFTTLRFDFRGAGQSEGSFDKGIGELHDLTAAAEQLRTHGDGPLLVTGWSFGAAVGLRYMVEHDDVAGWLGVALPLGFEDVGIPRVRAAELQQLDRPLCFVHGTDDDVARIYRVRALAEVAPTAELVAIEGGDHFLRDHREQVDEAVGSFADRLAKG